MEIGCAKRIWDFLGSRDLSVFILVMGCTYLLLLVIFGLAVPTPWVNRIATLLPFKVLYLLFFVNLIICEIKWTPVIIRRCRKPRAPETEEDLERFRHKVSVQSSEFRVQSLEKYLRKRGYKVQSPENNPPQSPLNLRGEEPPHVPPILYAYKGRFSPLGNLLFHLAFLFLLVGGLVSLFSRLDTSVMIMEGEEFAGGPVFRVERITPQYWSERFLFTDLRADVSYPNNGKLGSSTVRLSQPLRINGARITISGIGFSPMYLLKDKTGMELDAGYVRMNIFPPGAEDHFKIPGYPYKIYVSFYPDYEIKDGKIATRSMNLVNPAFHIKVFRNKVLSYDGLLKPGDEASYGDLKLSFPGLKYWGMFRIVRNPGFTFIWIAFILFGGGLIWRILFYRIEVAVMKEGDDIYLYGSSEYYHRLFENRLLALSKA